MNLRIVIPGIILIAICASCGHARTDLPASNPTPISKFSDEVLPANELKYLFDNSVQADVNIYDTSTSINFSNQEQVRNILRTLSVNHVAINNNCQPKGRLVFWSEKGLIIEADIYYGEGCNYYNFIKNNQVLYTNFYNESGVDLMKNILGG